ncbi:hypothetical protein DV737_g94, partial [Chaetothyriales sp. CBS 132003]
MAAKQPLRLLARRLNPHSRPCSRRAFSSLPPCLAASNFTMPAMSPTMTEGNITDWKVKEGDSFSAGDILLEIETDKASMDVEAQEDGVVAKIFSPDGSKAVKVGTRIAVLAEPGDDLASLAIPADESAPAVSASAKAEASDGKQTSEAATEVKKQSPAKDTAGAAPQGAGQNPKYPLYPSVLALVRENHVTDEEVAKIPATGPNRRLLKGDVLAYLGRIATDYSAKASKDIEHRSHLDLSNIKLLAEQPKAKAPTPEPAAAEAAQAPALTSVSLPISLSEVLKVQQRIQDTLGLSLPLSTFLTRAVDLANDDLPKPKGAKATADELFNAVLGLDSVPTTSRGAYLPQIDALPSSSVARVPLLERKAIKKPDIIDILSGNARPTAPRRHISAAADLVSPSGGSITTSGGAINVFSLTVPVGEEHRAKIFLQRIKTVLQVEPGRLVL